MPEKLLKAYKDIEGEYITNRKYWSGLREELTASVRAASLTERLSPEDYELRLGDAYDWLSLLYVHILPEPNDSDELDGPRLLWSKKDIVRAIFLDAHQAREELNFRGGSQNQVEQSVSVYLSREWMWNDHISFILIDYFLCEEIISYTNHLKATNPNGSINWLYIFTVDMEQQWQKYAIRLLAPIIWKIIWISWPILAAGIFYYYQLTYWSLGFLAYWAWTVFPIRYPIRYFLTTRKLIKERRKLASILEKTATFYNNFGGAVISPSIMREKLQQLEGAGWVFNQAIYAILGRAIERDPNVMKGLELYR